MRFTFFPCLIAALGHSDVMKHLLLLALSVSPLLAQFPVVPATPDAFKRRSTGGSGRIAPTADADKVQPPPIKRYISHVALSELRSWTSDDGKAIQAILLAFEDLRAESRDGAKPEIPAPPKHPTVVRDGQVRLGVNGKPVVLSLTRLSKSDQAFVEKVRLQHAAP